MQISRTILALLNPLHCHRVAAGIAYPGGISVQFRACLAAMRHDSLHS
jgi:hypothetical protein